MNGNGLHIAPGRQTMEPPFLTLPGLVCFGHNVYRKADIPLPTHTHKNCMELVVVSKGEECYQTENQSFFLSGGDVFVSFPSQPHQSGTPFQGVGEIYWFQLDMTCTADFLGLSQQNAAALLERLAGIREHIFRADREALELVQKSFSAFLNAKDGMYCASVFVHALSRLLFAAGGSNFDRKKFLTVDRYIDEHLCDAILLEDLCEASGMSLSTVKHKFKEYTGKTPRDYINSKKISKSKEFLAGGYSVTQAAMALGFTTSDYFSTVFRRYTAMTPTEYKTKLQSRPHTDSYEETREH